MHDGGMKKPSEDYGHLLWMDRMQESCPEKYPCIQFLEGEARRWVKAGTIYGLASAYTRSLVYVEWNSPTGGHIDDWLPAVGVHSVPDKDWYGLPLCE